MCGGGVGIAGQRECKRDGEEGELACGQTNFSELVILPGSPLNACWGVRSVTSRSDDGGWNAAFVKMETNQDTRHHPLQSETMITHDELGFGSRA